MITIVRYLDCHYIVSCIKYIPVDKVLSSMTARSHPSLDCGLLLVLALPCTLATTSSSSSGARSSVSSATVATEDAPATACTPPRLMGNLHREWGTGKLGWEEPRPH